VNRVIIFMLVAMVVVFSNVNILSAADGNSPAGTKATIPAGIEKSKAALKAGVKSDVNTPVEPNKVDPNDPNSPMGKWRKEFGESIERLEENKEDESREWTQRSTENRINRLKSIDSQVAEELDLIRNVALDEKAAKTVEAINRVLEVRKDRLAKLIESIEEARKEDRRKERQEKIEQRRKEVEDRRSRTGSR